MRTRGLACIVAVLVVHALVAVPAAAVESYTVEEVPTLGGDGSSALGINDLGEVVGFAKLPGGEFRAIKWANGVLTDLGTLGGNFSIAYDINDNGRISGQSESDVFPPGTRFAFFTDPGDPGLTALQNEPNRFNAIARSVNGSGQIAGVSLTIDTVDAVVWSSLGEIFPLPAFIQPGQGESQGDVWDSNDANDLAGWSMFIDPGNGFIGRRAALWPTGDPGGDIVDLGTLGGNGSEARGINDRGQIVGYAAVGGVPVTHAFLWEQDAMKDLGDLSATEEVTSWAQGINDAGVVVGFSQVSAGSTFEAFVWEADVMRNLNDLIPPGSGWLLTQANKINTAGQIVGEGIAPGGQVRGFVLTPACGSGTCDPDEDCISCPADCVIGAGAECGNGVCEAGDGEDCLSCPQDCNGKQSGNPNRRFCCGDGDGQTPVNCSDTRCDSGGLTCTEQPDPGTCCGDSICEGSEDSSNCSNDCIPAMCGDGNCDPGEDQCTCAADCGAPPGVESVCTDGVDDDCDGDVDCDDADCDGDQACTCLPKNASCSSDAECCSGDCKANGRCR